MLPGRSPEDTQPGRMCRVGYALNSKKLRQSSKVDEVAAAEDSGDAKRAIWRGGGLADVLMQPHPSITFEPFDYDVQNSKQVRGSLSQ